MIKYRFWAIVLMLIFPMAMGNSVLAKEKVAPDWGKKQFCSILGGKEKDFHLDKDGYTFSGQKGEKVLLTLSPKPSAPHSEKRATLMLTSRSKCFFKIDRGPLPSVIKTILPATGDYVVYVMEQVSNKHHKSFKGSYCLTLESSKGAWKTFQSFPSVYESRHPISWVPERIEETFSKGAAKELKVAFISRVNLQNVNLWVNPELKPFVRLEPNYFPHVEAHIPYEVVLRINIPPDTRSGHYDGTIHLRTGQRTYSQTLKVALHIIEMANKIPMAHAGPDQIIILPEGKITADVQLNGRGSIDPDGTIGQYIWSGTPDPDDVESPVLSLKQGIYHFSLIVMDNNDAASLPDSVTIKVLGPPFIAPLPPVTNEQTISLKLLSLPGSKIVLNSTTEIEVNEKGFLEIPVNLHPGRNDFVLFARLDDHESSSVSASVFYQPAPSIHLESISPLSGASGSILTLTGSGFTPDKNIMGVYFKGSEVDGRPALEGQGVVLEASATMLKVLVPFIFLKSEEEVEVYVYDGQNLSNSLPFRIIPAHDPTPAIKGNEVDYQLNLILTQLGHISNKLEQWTKPNVPQEKWALIEENLRRTQSFLETFKERFHSIPSEEVKSNLDALFGGEFLSLVTQQLEEINEILSHTTPCDIARVIQILNQILEPINDLNRVLDGIKDTLIGIQIGNGIACFLGCVPCCAAIPFLYEVYSTICAIDSVVDAIRSVFHTVITMMQAAVPTIPSEWKVAVTGPFPGISNHILYTGTTSELRVYANFTNAGFEQLVDMADLRLDIPDPGGCFLYPELFRH